MRVEPHTVGSIVHVVNRGARGMDIVRDKSDKWQFVKSVYLLNDTYYDENWRRDTTPLPLFTRPRHWPEREPLVDILAWTLMPNHFHLLLQEVQEGGIAKFMHRFNGSMSRCFNLKYGGQGSIFQSSYKGRTVNKPDYLWYVVFYILVKNVFELYPGGLQKAIREFDKAFDWALKYPFSSLRTCALGEGSPLIATDALRDLDLVWTPAEFKREAKNILSLKAEGLDGERQSLILEPWE